MGVLQVVDCREGTSDCKLVTSVNLVGRPQDIAVTGDVAYIPAGDAGLILADISDPIQPIVFEPPTQSDLEGTFFSGIVVRGQRAYVVRREEGREQFTVLSLDTPKAPFQLNAIPIGTLSRASVASAIAIAEPFAFLVQGASGLLAIDISNPGQLRRLSRVPTPSVALNVAVGDDLVYFTDQVSGLGRLRVLRTERNDVDGDGVIDPLDRFPRNAAESQDTDRDGLGNEADKDDDGDGFTDEEEKGEANTDSLDDGDFPVTSPPPGTTVIVVDSAAPFPHLPERFRNGTEELPYHSLTEAILAARQLRGAEEGPQSPLTILVRLGTYSPRTTRERFPLRLDGLTNLTIRGMSEGEPARIDAGFTEDIFFGEEVADISVEGLVLSHGVTGFFGRDIRGLTIRRNEISEHISDGVSLVNVSNGTIDDNTIRTNGSTGIFIGPASSVIITGNRITGNTGDGIFTEGAASVGIMGGNLIEANRQSGIALFQTSNATIENNIIRVNHVDGIALLSGSQGLIQNNTISDQGPDCPEKNCGGIFLATDTSSQIVGNRITGNNSDGISTSAAAAVDISGNNVIESNQGSGIVLKETQEAVIADNTIRANHVDGIALLEGSQGVIQNNTISDQGPNCPEQDCGGIFLDTDTSAQIIGNRIRANNSDGISMRSAIDVEISGENVIESNQGSGIVLDEASEATIEANLIKHNESDGIAFLGASRGVIRRNTISEQGLICPNGDCGGIFLDAGTSAQIIGNFIRNNNGDGIYTISATGLMITDNEVASNAISGIVLDETSDGTINGNTLIGNVEAGVALLNGSSATVRDNNVREQGGSGMFFENESDAVVDSNTITNNGLGVDEGSGIKLSGASAEIISGLITDHPNSGVFLEKGSTADIGLGTGVVTFERNEGCGIFVDGSNSTARINRNQIAFNERCTDEGNVVEVNP